MKQKLFFILVLLRITNYCFAQVETVRDTINNKQNFNVSTEATPLLIDETEFVVPDIEPPFNRQPITKENTPPQFAAPVYWATPYPQPKWGDNNHFRHDYVHLETFRLSPNSMLNTYSRTDTYFTMGTYINVGGVYAYRPNEKWEFTGGTYAAKYTMPSMVHGSLSDFGFNASIGYHINDWVAIRAVGQYSINGERNSQRGYLSSPMAPQSHYGVLMNLRVNDWLQFEGGVERTFDPIRRKWRNVPIFYPVIDFKKIGK